jgi:hypothetical protein
MTTLNHPELAGSCQIVNSGVFEEYLSIRPIDAVPGNHYLLIRSRLDSAKNPEVLHTRYSVTLTREAMNRLHDHLGSYLRQSESGGLTQGFLLPE